MAEQDIALMAHLMRRAGFGATREELEALVEKGYETVVEELLNPQDQPDLDRFELIRYQPWVWKPGTLPGMGSTEWLWFMINTKRPLEEKVALFWHHLFATGVSKVDHYDEITAMVALFREKGMGSYKELLLELSRNPAMIYWLDNNENHADAVNENWGRELLELFSMGVGNYTEVDVREASRAFTGWTIEPKLPRGPIGRHDWHFTYLPEDHDDGEKTFLGETGNFDGEDILNIVCEHPATATFIARHLYNYFVADEAQVPAWAVTPPRDQDAIDALADALRGLRIRHPLHPAGAVQLRLLQERPLRPVEEPRRSGHRYPEAGGRPRVPGPRLGRVVPAAQLHGPGPAQSPQRGGLAHRRGMDQQRFPDAPHQLHR